jgi:DNA-binding MarR family transcriptional regulator
MATQAPKSTDTGCGVALRRSSPSLLLGLIGQEAMRRLREAHTVHNLKPRQFQLLALLHEDGAMGQRELGQAMDVDPSVLVTLLNPLEADGLISRERDLDDRRRHLVTLTPAGERHLDCAAQAQRDTDEALLAGLGADEREQLNALLVAVLDNLAQGADESACDSAT